MRSTLVILAAALAATALTGCQKKDAASQASASGAAPATATGGGTVTLNDIPHRKSGLWEQSMTMSAINRTVSTQTCVDEASEAKTSFWSQNKVNDDCSVAKVDHGLDGSWNVESTCKMKDGTTVSSQAKASGDFSSHYTVHVASTVSGAPMAAMNGQHTYDLEAKWVGPCPAGMTGGDSTLPGGGKINITKAMKP